MPESHSKPKILWFVNAGISNQDIDAQQTGAGKGWLATLAHTLATEFDLTVAYVDPYASREDAGRIRTRPLRPAHWRLKLIAGMFVNLPHKDGDLLEQMKQIITETQPDIIHVHGTEKQYIRIHDFARSQGIPLLLSLQGIMSAIATRYTAYLSESELKRTRITGGGAKRLLPQSAGAFLKAHRKQAQLEAQILPHIDFFEGRTRWDRQIATLFNPKSTYFEVNRVLKTPFYEAMWTAPEPSTPLTLHTTTGSGPFKGFDVIADACAWLQTHVGPVTWRVAGLSPNDWIVRTVKRKMGRRYPKEAIKLIGRQNAAGLISSMQTAHLYVMASHIENSPNNLAEAMMIGMPCIATLAGGTGTYVQDGVNGLLVQPGEPVGLAAAVAELYRNPDQAQTLGQAARATALARHDPKTITDAMSAAYHHMLEGRSS
jgi:glycosyltransferase involved in cell wall biosynthesis